MCSLIVFILKCLLPSCLQLLEREHTKSHSALKDYKAVCVQLKAKDEQITELQSQNAESEKATQLDRHEKERQINHLTKAQKVYMYFLDMSMFSTFLETFMN